MLNDYTLNGNLNSPAVVAATWSFIDLTSSLATFVMTAPQLKVLLQLTAPSSDGASTATTVCLNLHLYIIVLAALAGGQ